MTTVPRSERRLPRPLWAWVLVAILALATGCDSSDEQTAGTETASSTTLIAGSGGTEPPDDAAPAGTTPTTVPPPSPSTPSPSTPPTTGSFCDELERLIDDWVVGDTLGPPELTGRYAALAAIAPNELVESLGVLEEGNAVLVATRDIDQLPDKDAYEAAGAQVARYAAEVCGIVIA